MSEAKSPELDSPYKHNNVANELELQQDIRGAEREFKAAVNAADKLPYDLYRRDFLSELGKYELSDKYEAYPGIGLEELRRSYHKLLVLPFVTRFQLAAFYARHGAYPEAEEVIGNAFQIGLDDLVVKDQTIINLLKRAQEFHGVVVDIIGPAKLSRTFDQNFERMDLNKDGFINEDELKKAQLDIGIDSEGQKMIRHLLYHFLEAEASSHDEWIMDISGLSKRDVRIFEENRNKTWKRFPSE